MFSIQSLISRRILSYLSPRPGAHIGTHTRGTDPSEVYMLVVQEHSTPNSRVHIELCSKSSKKGGRYVYRSVRACEGTEIVLPLIP